MRTLNRIIKACTRYGSRTDGATAVEFGFVSLAFFMLLFMVFETCRFFFVFNMMQYAAEETTRYAMVTENPTDQELRDFYLEQIPTVALADKDDINTDVEYDSADDIDFVRVSANYNYDAMGVFLPQGMDNIRIAVTSRIALP